jgi:hypothetical protein
MCDAKTAIHNLQDEFIKPETLKPDESIERKNRIPA